MSREGDTYRCDTCFWSFDGTLNVGPFGYGIHCRYDPPKLVVEFGDKGCRDIKTMLPSVEEDFYCGKYKPKEE